MELIKTAIKVGNSAGVILPRKYLNSQVKIVLEPLNIEKDVLEILMGEGMLTKVLGVYLVGSYARGEQTIESDIDLLVITSDINKRIAHGRYEIICISKAEIERQLKENALPILMMIKESKVIINQELIENYKNYKLNEKNIKWHINTTKSRIKAIAEDVKLYKKVNEKYMSDNIAYIIILRLRTLYIIERIKKNKTYKKKDFLKLVRDLSGSLRAYEGYIRSKNNEKVKKELPISEVEKITDYIIKNIKK